MAKVRIELEDDDIAGRVRIKFVPSEKVLAAIYRKGEATPAEKYAILAGATLLKTSQQADKAEATLKGIILP
jgi:hypothetical protein